MPESLFDELKRYVLFDERDAQTLVQLGPTMEPHIPRIADTFYRRILDHSEARTALEGGESKVGKLKITLQQWMRELFAGDYGEGYYERRARIGRVHVRIALPQHYMFGAMNVLRLEMVDVIAKMSNVEEDFRDAARRALNKILDLELGIMLHTYREDLLSQQARVERLSTFGQLVGSIGHELRNPLGVIETSLFVLRGRVGSDERVGKHVDRIGEQVKIANDIITQLLDMIRDRPLQRQAVSLNEAVASAVGALTPPAEVKVTVKMPELPLVNGDPVQLRQVLLNLLENAVQATAPKGEVTVEGSSLPGFVDVSVEDTGKGVDPSIRARLFEPLVTTKQKGIGLGLALVKRIVERHGGTIAYMPRAGATGARFVVRLPVIPT